jgi:uncharacterized iron-regulated membrane protein
MKLEYFFFALFGLLLAATGMLAMHYRGELMAERRINELRLQPSAIPQSPAVPAPPPSAPSAVDQAALDRAALQRQIEQAESETNLLTKKVNALGNPQGTDPAADAADAADAAVIEADPTADAEALTATQRRIKEAPSIAKIQQYLPDQGFAVIDAGSARGLKTGQTYAVRRGHFLVAKKVEVGETVEESEAIVGVNASALQPGETLKAGDEVIKWE